MNPSEHAGMVEVKVADLPSRGDEVDRRVEGAARSAGGGTGLDEVYREVPGRKRISMLPWWTLTLRCILL